MSSDVRTRFAPSPTGYLHVGGARTALFNWLFARRHGGSFVLRVEDTDAARNTPEARQAIFDGLRWLGIGWDEGPEVGGDHGPYFQSERQEIYQSWLRRLEERDLVYDDAGAVRFRSPGGRRMIRDHIRGDVEVDRTHEPDMTLRRPDGSFIFHFVNVVDDIEMRISHVIRGEDHLLNTAKHLELYEALGAPAPEFAHIPLILNEDGSKMSKRDQGASLAYYPDNGFLPEAVRNYLCLLGWNPKDDREKLAIEDVVALFDWDHLNASSARFDIDKCSWLNGQYIAELDAAEFALQAAPFAPEGTPAAALALVQPKVRTLSEVADHLAPILDGDLPVEPEAASKARRDPAGADRLAALATRFASVAETDWTEDSIRETVAATAADAGVKQGALMFPLRVAATGRGQGTDLVPTLVVLGREETVRRLRHRIPAIFEDTPPEA